MKSSRIQLFRYFYREMSTEIAIENDSKRLKTSRILLQDICEPSLRQDQSEYQKHTFLKNKRIIVGFWQ